jgi:mRNA interferase RelE/StbE
MTGDRFRVEIASPAARALGRLSPKLVDAVLRFLDGPLAENPLRVTKPLGAELQGLRSGYVGISYRVLVRIDEENRIVNVMRIDHRADAYRSL